MPELRHVTRTQQWDAPIFLNLHHKPEAPAKEAAYPSLALQACDVVTRPMMDTLVV